MQSSVGESSIWKKRKGPRASLARGPAFFVQAGKTRGKPSVREGAALFLLFEEREGIWPPLCQPFVLSESFLSSADTVFATLSTISGAMASALSTVVSLRSIVMSLTFSPDTVKKAMGVMVSAPPPPPPKGMHLRSSGWRA